MLMIFSLLLKDRKEFSIVFFEQSSDSYSIFVTEASEPEGNMALPGTLFVAHLFKRPG